MNIYDYLYQIIDDEIFRLQAVLFQHEDRENLDDNDKDLFDILGKISTLYLEINHDGAELKPEFVMADGRRSFSIEDLCENDYQKLKNLDLNRVPNVIRARVADLLWIYKKDYKYALIAADTYWNLFCVNHCNGEITGMLDLFRRALGISTQVAYSILLDKIVKWVNEFINSMQIYADIFGTLRLLEILSDQKDYDVSTLLNVLDKIIAYDYNNIAVIEQAYELKTSCLFKLRRSEEATNNNILLADYYIDFAEKIFEKNKNEAMRAVHFYIKGVKLYRNNGQPEKAQKAHKRMIEIQQEITNNMMPFSIKFDIKGLIDNLRKNMEGLTFEECVLRLTQMIGFESKSGVKQRVIEKCRKDPISHLFGKNQLNSKGQTVLALEPLDISNPEKDLELLELHMHQDLLENQKIMGDLWIKNALLILREKFVINKSMLTFIVKDNPIIPEGRERIFLSALYMFLNGEYYEAMHILAPQTENLFRYIASEVGGLTVSLEDDGTSKEKLLNSVFSIPELLDCYDNDIIFTFKGLLIERAGANIRNEIAHGIISEYACSTGVCLYFGIAVLKLLSLTSNECIELLHNSENLHHFVKPDRDAIKKISTER